MAERLGREYQPVLTKCPCKSVLLNNLYFINYKFLLK